MNLLICVPVIRNAVVFDEMMNQVMYKRNVTVIILDNNASEDVKEKIQHYMQYPQIKVWVNMENEFVVKPWNRFIKYFLDSDFDRLIIMNSDLTLNKNWADVCNKLFDSNPEYTLTPKISDDKRLMFETILPTNKIHVVTDGVGIPGVFITLSKDQAQCVYPFFSSL